MRLGLGSSRQTTFGTGRATPGLWTTKLVLQASRLRTAACRHARWTDELRPSLRKLGFLELLFLYRLIHHYRQVSWYGIDSRCQALGRGVDQEQEL